MKTTGMLMAVAAAMLWLLPIAATAQDDQPLYVSVDCMKSADAGYPRIETDIWLPMHQELVDQGRINSWAFYFVRYGDRSRCDYYTVTTYLGGEQLNSPPAIDEVFAKVHPRKDMTREMVATWSSRQHVATELWIHADGTEIRKHRFANVNKMYAPDPDAYERMESRVFKAGHQQLLEGGYRSGWAMYRLVSPTGTSIPYNYGTVDFSNHLDPVPMAEAMLQAHPDRDLEALQELLDLRDHISSETWVLVAATTAPGRGD